MATRGTASRALRQLALAFAALLVLALPATAVARDRDHDGLPDRWEKKHHLSVSHASASADPDRDHVDNWNEHREGTDPRDRDSDNDGRRDGREDRDRDGLSNSAENATGNDPRDRDTDNDGVRDGREQAGTISSYENGTLRIRLATGGSVTGQVTDETEIRCASVAESEHRHAKAAVRANSHGQAGAAADDPGAGPGDPGDPAGDPLEDISDPSDDFGDDPSGDDPSDDMGADPAPGSRRCSAGALRRGVRVHQAETFQGDDGLVFSLVQAVDH
jgi:Bacterial TSP3 repeat